MGPIWDPGFPPGGRRIVLVVHCCLLSFITVASLGWEWSSIMALVQLGIIIDYGAMEKMALAPWFKRCGFIRCGEIKETCDQRVGTDGHWRKWPGPFGRLLIRVTSPRGAYFSHRDLIDQRPETDSRVWFHSKVGVLYKFQEDGIFMFSERIA